MHLLRQFHANPPMRQRSSVFTTATRHVDILLEANDEGATQAGGRGPGVMYTESMKTTRATHHYLHELTLEVSLAMHLVLFSGPILDKANATFVCSTPTPACPLPLCESLLRAKLPWLLIFASMHLYPLQC